jgi:tRNA-dihydrouridine synthase B
MSVAMINFNRHTLFMAPMAEITTPSLRRCIRQFSRNTVLYSEMLSAAAIVCDAAHNEPLMKLNENDTPYVFQILGGDPEIMAQACVLLAEKNCSGIDINMGCSAPDILKKFQGSRLLSDKSATAEIVRRSRKSYNGTLSVKMRSGFDASDENYLLDFARMLEAEGIDYITLHPRHGKLSFRRTADWALVKKLKDNLKIPVVGNGDISCPEDVQQRFNETNCDGIMIGRNAVVSPWIFAVSEQILAMGSYRVEVNLMDIYRDVLLGIKNDLPPHLHKSRAHRFSFYFLKNFVYSHDLFRKIRNLQEPDLMIEIIEEYVTRNPHEKVKIITGGQVNGIYQSLGRGQSGRSYEFCICW